MTLVDRGRQLGAGRAHRPGGCPASTAACSAATSKAPPRNWRPTSTRPRWPWRATRRAHQLRERRRRQLLRDPHRRGQPVRLRRRRQRRVPGRRRGRARGPVRAGRPVSLKSNSRSVLFDPDKGHQHAHCHDAAAGTQRQRHPPGDEHHGAGALVLAGTGGQRLSPLLMTTQRPGDRRRSMADGRAP